MSEKSALTFDFQGGAANSATVGFTYNFTPQCSIAPALYRTNGSPHHLPAYVVPAYSLTIWKQ